MKSRLSALTPQLVCIVIAFFALYPMWNETTIGQKVFGVAWLSFILGIFASKPSQVPPKAS